MATICFTSDYGTDDEYVGVCHGVMLRIAPDARIIDVSHGVARGDVRTGAVVLRRALPYMPAAIQLAVVDPGVGGRRRPLALRARDGTTFVGPDNGLLWPAVEARGGVEAAVDLANSPAWLEPRSTTFHGRDLFAPVAARLACGEQLDSLGEPIELRSLVRLDLPVAEVFEGFVRAHVLLIDRFGNVALDVGPTELERAGLDQRRLDVNGRRIARAEAFGDVPPGEPLLHLDSAGALAIAVNHGSAAELLGLSLGDELSLTPCR